MLEFDDIQHIVVTRVPALTGRYEFLSFRQAAQGRAWLAGMLDKVASVQQARDSIEREQRWVSVAFTWQGLRALGVDEQRTGDVPGRISARHGRARGSAWRYRQKPSRVGGLAASPVRRCTQSPFYSRAMLRSASALPASTRRFWQGHRVSKCFHHWIWTAFRHLTTRTIISAIATGSLSRKSKEVGIEPTPGSGAPVKAGEFILGHVDESGQLVPLPQPEVLSRNGTFMAYRRLQEHVGAFRDFLATAWRPNNRGPGTDRGEADGTLAERRSARSGAREGRSSAGG